MLVISSLSRKPYNIKLGVLHSLLRAVFCHSTIQHVASPFSQSIALISHISILHDYEGRVKYIKCLWINISGTFPFSYDLKYYFISYSYLHNKYWLENNDMHDEYGNFHREEIIANRIHKHEK